MVHHFTIIIPNKTNPQHVNAFILDIKSVKGGDELSSKFGGCDKIFVCSTSDLFGNWVPQEWIWEVLSMAKTAGWHTFQFLTKNPKRMQDFPFEKNMWIGATVDEIQYEQRILDLALVRHNNLFLSFEPLITRMKLTRYTLANIKWIIIGGMTGKDAVQPKEEWITELLDQAVTYRIPVFMKNNLKPIWKGTLRQEFPVRR